MHALRARRVKAVAAGSAGARSASLARPERSAILPPQKHSCSFASHGGTIWPTWTLCIWATCIPHTRQSMIRVSTVFLMLAGTIATLPLSYANAQSPNPASIAPGPSGAGLAPPTPSAPSPQPRNAVPDPAPGGNTVQAPSGATPVPSTMTQGVPSTSGSSSRSPSKK
jgi:hypothetical protein